MNTDYIECINDTFYINSNKNINIHTTNKNILNHKKNINLYRITKKNSSKQCHPNNSLIKPKIINFLNQKRQLPRTEKEKLNEIYSKLKEYGLEKDFVIMNKKKFQNNKNQNSSISQDNINNYSNKKITEENIISNDINKNFSKNFSKQSIIMDKAMQIINSRNGKIEKKEEEIIEFDENDEDIILKAFQHFDTDNTGKINVEEIKHVLTFLGDIMTQEEVDKFFKSVDIDNNGCLDYREFIKFWMNND